MRMPRIAAVLAFGVLASACAERAPSGAGPSIPGAPTGEARYQATVTVLEGGGKAAHMCWSVAESLPPQCGDVPITNWSWDDVEGEERMRGVIWGVYHLTGTYDGEVFTVTKTGPPQDPGPFDDDEIVTPCEEPEGGWQTRDPERATETYMSTITPEIEADPEHAGLWVDYLGDPPAEESSNAGAFVLTVAVTGDVERHRADLEEIWGGPLCVVAFEHTLADLQRIQAELGDGSGAGLHLLSSSVAVTRNRVEAMVVLAAEEDQAAMDARYGPGTVVLESALQPAD